jgi:hypothetical protein
MNCPRCGWKAVRTTLNGRVVLLCPLFHVTELPRGTCGTAPTPPPASAPSPRTTGQ